MSARAPRFEVVQSDAGFFARFRAANGRIVWVTEMYVRRSSAIDAIALIAFSLVYDTSGTWVSIDGVGYVEIRTIDERTELKP